MGAKIIDVSNGVVALLNANAGPLCAAFTIPETFVASLETRPAHDAQSLAGLTLSIVPRTRTETAVSRSAKLSEFQVDIGIQKKIIGTDDEEKAYMLQLLDFVERCSALFKPGLVIAGEVWIRIENAPLYSFEHLEEDRIFTSVLSVHFKK